MTAAIDEPLRRRRFSVAEYRRMGEVGILGEDDRVELIEGEIVEMTPIGSPHGGGVKRLNRLFTRAVGERAVIAVQDPVVLGERSEPEPDIAVLRPRADFYSHSHPEPPDVLLLIEVSDSSLATDRDIKVPLYARHGIPEVWILDLTHKQVIRFAAPHAGIYRDQGPIDLARPVSLPGLEGCVVDLGEVFGV